MPAGDRQARGSGNRCGMRTPRSAGFALIAALALVAVVATGLAVVGVTWQHAIQRDREQQLFRIGPLYAAALEEYYQSAPGNFKAYPLKLEDLLADVRYVGLVRHLRELYTDPIVPGVALQPVRSAAGQVIGVVSTSTSKMLLNDGALTYTQYPFLAPSASSASSAAGTTP